jgi:hypothetical protein
VDIQPNLLPGLLPPIKRAGAEVPPYTSARARKRKSRARFTSPSNLALPS